MANKTECESLGLEAMNLDVIEDKFISKCNERLNRKTEVVTESDGLKRRIRQCEPDWAKFGVELQRYIEQSSIEKVSIHYICRCNTNNC